MGRREDLETLRQGLFDSFELAGDSVKAQIAAQLRAVIKDLADLPDTKAVNPIDEFTAARARRRADAQVS